MTTKQKIYNFFEKPKSLSAKFVQFLIFVFIILSVGLVSVEYFYVDIFEANKSLFLLLDYIILAAFTVEYLLRLFTAPKKFKFAKRPLNIIDFLAVFPNYLEFIVVFSLNTTALRALRVVRLLRFSRLLRVLKLFKYGKLFKKVLRYQGTILESITQVIIMFIVGKSIIWLLESHGFWIENSNLGELFAIIGFALGIILAQKISSTYGKFLQVEESAVELYGILHSLSIILDKINPKSGTKVCKAWATAFLKNLKDPKASSHDIHSANLELYREIQKAEQAPAELAILHGDICKDAAFCLSKKVHLTPKPYDTLLHQSTMLYLLLITVFIPGFAGMLSVIVATYILYGMYNLTQDFDSIIGGEFDLINIDISELENFAKSS